MNCNCGNKNEGNFPPSVFQVNSTECPVLFHKVVIPTNFGDETETPVLMGKYKNALVYYEVNGHTYLYSSDGVPTRLDRGGASVLYVEELPETNKAMQDTLYVSSRGELAVYKGGDKKILNEKPTYYTTLGNNTDGAMTQKAVTDALSALSEEVKNKLAEFKNGVVDKVMPEVNDKVSGMERFVTAKIEEMKRETSTLVNTTTNDVNLMKNSLNKHIEQADIAKNDLLDKIRRNTDSITDTKNSLRNYALISDVDSRVSDAKAELNNKITQAETRVNNTIGQAKIELNGKIAEANNKTSALDTKFTKLTSDNKAEATQIKANLATTNSVLSTHKELVDKKFTDVNTEQTSQNSLISDILNAFSKESEKGTNLKLNSSATKVLGMTIYGNTEQNKYTGKNLLKLSTNPTVSNGLSSIITDDGIVKYSGKTTDSWGDITTLLYFPAPLPIGKYTFSIDHPRTHRIIFKYRLADNSFSEVIANMTATSTSNTFTTTRPIIAGYLYIVAANGSSLNDTVKAQLEIGDTATDYEPYTGGYNNLFDEFSNLPIQKNGISLTNQNGILKLSGKPDADWVPLIFRDLNGLVDKTTYTVVAYNSNTTQLFSEIMLYKKDGSGIDKITSKGQKVFTFTTDSTKYNRYAMKLGLGPTSEFSEPVTIYNNYALFQGNYNEYNLPEYSPYNTGLAIPRPQYPQVVKELSETNVQITNKNFFRAVQQNPIPNFKSVIEEDGSITFGGAIYQWWGTNLTTSHNVIIPANQTYTLSIDKPLPYAICLAIFGKNGRISVGEPIIGKDKTSITFTPSEDIVRFHLYLSINGTGWSQNTPMPETNIKVQLEKGDTATTYVKHESSEFTIPSGFNLYKLTDDIYDEIKLEGGVAKLIKRVGKLELSGDESNINLYRTRADGSLGFQWRSPSGEFLFTQQQELATIVSSHFSILREPSAIGNNDFSSGIGLFKSGNDPYPRYANNITIWLSLIDMQRLRITDINTFKNWLKSEKAKGTPVTVYYEMKTSTEEEITDPVLLTELKRLIEMRTYQDVTNISITGTDLTPDIKVKYMRKIGE